MLFNSLAFLVFFPVVLLVHLALPKRFRWAWLLVASCYFYGSFIPQYLLILFLLIGFDYCAGIAIEVAPIKRKKSFLLLSLAANISLLGFFKYFNFFTDNVHTMLGAFGWSGSLPHLEIILPIGLSFHTFQSMAYTIEVYRGTQKAERNLGVYALYVMYFPQLVAGPIERPGHMLSQLHQPRSFGMERTVSGMRLMLWGFFKKVVVADNLATLVNNIYGDPTRYSGIPLLLATYFFAFQIYCDFSGYTDIATGLARIFGVDLTKNFDRPYASRSISEFWRRWHISLSSWFRDYLYIDTLGGNRKGQLRTCLNVLIVFLVSGLWHGAAWTYVAWGGLHGIYLVFGILTSDLRARLADSVGISRFPRLLHAWQVLISFHLVCFAWIFFRANSLSDAVHVVTHLFSGIDLLFLLSNLGKLGAGAGVLGQSIGIGRPELLLALLAVGVLEAVQLARSREGWWARFRSGGTTMRWAAYYGIVLSILVYGNFDAREFIYFQF